MKTMKKKTLMIVSLLFGTVLTAQQFELTKSDLPEFNGLLVNVGGDFTIQFQSLDHSSEIANLYELVSNFNLPTANFNLDVQLADGVNLYMRTYLSSRHHNDTWVKGGHIQFDRLDIISDGFLSGLMDLVTLSVGLDEINYGDAHFRRTDNAEAINNPFVGNYIMDSFVTEVFGEAMVHANGFLGIIGLSNGKLNQNITVTNRDNGDNKLSFYGKLGYDSQLGENLRLRLTGSWYINHGTTTGTHLYYGDRSGSRYYSVLVVDKEDDVFTSGRFNPGFSQITALQVNPFIKFNDLEFFGIYEIANGGDEDGHGGYSQIAAEILYRFGNSEQFYISGRYNTVSGEQTEDSDTKNINRINVGGGWFLTENLMAKAEYVQQTYSGDGWNDQSYQGAEFSGIVFEATISF